MICLTTDRIYEYLEGLTSEEEFQHIQDHLQQCPRCRASVEERKHLLDAFQSLSEWDTPAGMTEEIMAAVYPASVLTRSGLRFTFAGLAAMMFFFFGFLAVSGHNLISFLKQSNHILFDLFRNISIFVSQTIKIFSTLFKATQEIISYGFKLLFSLNSILSPSFQLGLFLFTVIASLSILWMMRKRIFHGARS